MDAYSSYRKLADQIEWQSLTNSDVFFNYIKHEYSEDRDVYYSAIVCKFWGYAGRIFLKCNKHLQFELCYDIIIDAINYVIKNRVWENPTNSLYGDPSGPDKAMHIAMKRFLHVYLSRETADKRQANFNTMSIDAQTEDWGNVADGMFTDVASEGPDVCWVIVKDYFTDGDYMKGILADFICYNNMSELNINYLQQQITGVRYCYDYYADRYYIDKEQFLETARKIDRMSPRLLRVKLKQTVADMKGRINYG